jgi:low affinity Fe/Cu permease
VSVLAAIVGPPAAFLQAHLVAVVWIACILAVPAGYRVTR